MSTYEMQLLAEQNAATADAEVRSVERRIALGRTAAPAEIAASCLFLASDEASFITGAVAALSYTDALFDAGNQASMGEASSACAWRADLLRYMRDRRPCGRLQGLARRSTIDHFGPVSW
jgi:hypothetical protein